MCVCWCVGWKCVKCKIHVAECIFWSHSHFLWFFCYCYCCVPSTNHKIKKQTHKTWKLQKWKESNRRTISTFMTPEDWASEREGHPYTERGREYDLETEGQTVPPNDIDMWTHHAEQTKVSRQSVGWGRVPSLFSAFSIEEWEFPNPPALIMTNHHVHVRFVYESKARQSPFSPCIVFCRLQTLPFLPSPNF